MGKAGTGGGLEKVPTYLHLTSNLWQAIRWSLIISLLVFFLSLAMFQMPLRHGSLAENNPKHSYGSSSSLVKEKRPSPPGPASPGASHEAGKGRTGLSSSMYLHLWDPMCVFTLLVSETASTTRAPDLAPIHATREPALAVMR